jgi:hypothetical protein
VGALIQVMILLYTCIPVYMGLHPGGSYLVFYENAHDGEINFNQELHIRMSAGCFTVLLHRWNSCKSTTSLHRTNRTTDFASTLGAWLPPISLGIQNRGRYSECGQLAFRNIRFLSTTSISISITCVDTEFSLSTRNAFLDLSSSYLRASTTGYPDHHDPRSRSQN